MASGVVAHQNPAPDTKFYRDLTVKGLFGILLSTQVESPLGALGLAMTAELGVIAVGKIAPGLYPPDPQKTVAHRVIGVGATLGGWGFGRALHRGPLDECLDDDGE